MRSSSEQKRPKVALRYITLNAEEYMKERPLMKGRDVDAYISQWLGDDPPYDSSYAILSDLGERVRPGSNAQLCSRFLKEQKARGDNFLYSIRLIQK